MGVATVEMEKVERVGIYWEVGFLVFCLFVWVLEGSRGGEEVEIGEVIYRLGKIGREEVGGGVSCFSVRSLGGI